MKYLYLVVAVLFLGCSDKSPEVEKVVIPSNVAKPVVTHVRQTVLSTPVVSTPVLSSPVVEMQEEVHAVSRHETIIEEPMVTKRIGSNVPSSCLKWSDGCNVCTRKGKGKASCTTNPECHNKVFSCLQWP